MADKGSLIIPFFDGMSIVTKSFSFLGKEITFETGRLAKLATGSVTVRYGETIVLVTNTVSDRVRDGIDYFPLLVDYQEKFYATGKMKGSRFIKREGRPSDKSILAGRMVDRPLRPLFPKTMRNDMQIVISILSADMENNPEDLAILGSSLASMLTGVPYGGPVAGVRVGLVEGQLKANPNYDELAASPLDLVVAGTENAITMIESAAKEVDTDTMMKALELAHVHIKELCAMQKEFVAMCGERPQIKIAYTEVAEDAATFMQNFMTSERIESVFGHGNDLMKFRASVTAVKDQMLAEAEPNMKRAENPWSKNMVAELFDKYLHKGVRAKMMKDKIRLDGRGLTDVRPISCEVGLIPRTHGSGLFNRGQTQVLSLATLGSPGDAQVVDEMDATDEKRYMHHYNFPGFSVGEVTPMRGPGRREIGHGDLAERAIMAVLPSKEEFPYTLRVVSEVLGSNGSTSMGSVCGSTLCLMDAGVPLKAPVSGIAMGLIMGDNGEYIVLTDIQGQEDFLGDMDFKVAGTAKGITALQLDIKIEGLTMEILRTAIEHANTGRAFILGKMLEVQAAARTELSQYAPRIISMKIPVSSIGEVIGPGGKMIRSIIEMTGCKIDIDDDGIVMITSSDGEGGPKAQEFIQRLTYVPQVGDEFEGKVKRIMEFGALVEYAPGKEGMVHISEMAPFRVNRVEDIMNLGDMVKVRVLRVEEGGKIGLSHKEYCKIDPSTLPPAPPMGERRPMGDRGDRGPRRFGDRGDRPRGDRPHGDRPMGDRPRFDDRPRDDQPREERPRPEERPAHEDRPQSDQRPAPRHDIESEIDNL